MTFKEGGVNGEIPEGNYTLNYNRLIREFENDVRCEISKQDAALKIGLNCGCLRDYSNRIYKKRTEYLSS